MILPLGRTSRRQINVREAEGMDIALSGVRNTGTWAESQQSVSGGSSADFAAAMRSSLQTGQSLDDLFKTMARQYGVPEKLLKAVAKVESGFDASATSSCGAMGIMQLMPSTAQFLGVADAYDPAQNIMGGAKYLRGLLDHFDGDASLAVAAYNAGTGAVESYGGIPPYAETQAYVSKVLGYAEGDFSVGSSAVTSVGWNTGEKQQTLLSGIFSAAKAMDAEMTLSYLMKMMLLKEQTELGKDPEEI